MKIIKTATSVLEYLHTRITITAAILWGFNFFYAFYNPHVAKSDYYLNEIKNNNPKFVRVDLSYTPGRDDNWILRSFVSIINLFLSKLELQTLAISAPLISTKKIKELTFALEHNNAVEVLNLRQFCVLTTEHAKIFATALKNNTTLKRLSLSGMGLQSEAIVILLQALANNPSLKITHLDLSDNCIDNIGAQAIDDFLKSNKSIVQLNLANNKNLLSDSTADQFPLKTALSMNHSLKELNLSDSLCIDLVAPVLQAINNGGTIGLLDIAHNTSVHSHPRPMMMTLKRIADSKCLHDVTFRAYDSPLSLPNANEHFRGNWRQNPESKLKFLSTFWNNTSNAQTCYKTIQSQFAEDNHALGQLSDGWRAFKNGNETERLKPKDTSDTSQAIQEGALKPLPSLPSEIINNIEKILYGNGRAIQARHSNRERKGLLPF